MTQTRWWKYVTKLIGDSSYSAAADIAGFDKSAFTRWKKGAKADPEFVIKLARAYNANVLEALVEAEFITEEEAQTSPAKFNPNLINMQGIVSTSLTVQKSIDRISNQIKELTNPFKQITELVKSPGFQELAKRGDIYSQMTEDEREQLISELGFEASPDSETLEKWLENHRSKNSIGHVADRRSNLHVLPDSYDDDDTMPEDAAAYGGPDEDKLREERGEYGFDT